MAERSTLNNGKPVYTFLFVLGALCLTGILAFQPYHNWDMIPYIASALEWGGGTPEEVHAETYQILRSELSEQQVTVLTSGEYRERCLQEPGFFSAQLPFYRVKPLYIGGIVLGAKAGLPWSSAVRLPSLLGYLAIALLFWFWLGNRVGPLRRFLIAFLSMAIYPVTELARLATPDGLAVFFLCLVFWRIEQGRTNIIPLILFTLLAIAARPDYAIYGLALFTSLRFLSPFRQESWISTAGYVGVVGLIAALPLLIGPAVGNSFTWFMAFNHAGSPGGYLHLIKESASFFNMTWLMVFLFFGILALPLFRKIGFEPREKGLILMTLITIISRLVLFPSIQERFFVAQYLMMIVIIVVWVGRVAGSDGFKEVRNNFPVSPDPK